MQCMRYMRLCFPVCEQIFVFSLHQCIAHFSVSLSLCLSVCLSLSDWRCFQLTLNCVIFVCLLSKQLSPTIQGSQPQHEAGLEQTMFDRLMKMVRSRFNLCLFFPARVAYSTVCACTASNTWTVFIYTLMISTTLTITPARLKKERF